MLYNVSQLSAEKCIQFIFKFFWVRQICNTLRGALSKIQKFNNLCFKNG